MDDIARLRQQIKKYYKRNQYSPTVRISEEFWNCNHHAIADLSKEGIDIHVDQNLTGETSFIIEVSEHEHQTVNTLNDLKIEVDKLVDEGKGDWPVHYLPHDAQTYLRIKLCPIIPGEAPVEGLELRKGYADAPKGEHILILVGNTH